jgi:ABC-type spermidine/putrescine transport system permease subunit II
VVRTVQPVLRDWDTEYEHAALSLGANRTTILRRVIFPEILPAWLRGLALAPANPFVFKFLGSYKLFYARKSDGKPG